MMKHKAHLFRALPLISSDSLDGEVNPPSRRAFVIGSLIHDEEVPFIIEGGVVEATDEYIQLARWTPVDNRTIGMSTGVMDKKGKMIYEGDIVQSHVTDGVSYTNWKKLPCLCIVYYEKGHFKLSFLGVFQAYDKRYKNGWYFINNCDEGLDGELLEVIDNIHGGCVR